ncbi:MAG: aldehyde dehydrogenase family protein [Alphaproteobacteria bacterium]
MNALNTVTEDIPAIFAKLQANTAALKARSATERAARITALMDEVLKRKHDLIAASEIERGSQDLDVAAELMMLKMESDFIAKNVGKWMKRQKVKGSMAAFGKTSYVLYEPKGVVLNLSTWNAPAVISFYPLLPAIAAGNACLLKPSELAPHSSKILKEIVEAVFPADEFAVVEGGPEVASALLEQPFNHIYYTGGHRVGRIVMEAAAKHFASVTLEMGGKSPAIIDKSADLDNAATKIIWGRMANAGQICVAPDHVLTPAPFYDATVEALIGAAKRMYDSEGKGYLDTPEVCKIINHAHFDRVVGLIEDAKAKGATVAHGGNYDRDSRKVEPTILTNVTEDMDVMRDEIFGPVLPVMAYDRLEDVPAIIEKRSKPLALYVYGKDKQALNWMVDHSTAGSTVLNHNCVQSGTNPNLPFGGVGHSGMGRVGGFRGFQEMSNNRALMVQHLDRIRDMAVNLPPYSDRYRSLVSKGLGGL